MYVIYVYLRQNYIQFIWCYLPTKVSFSSGGTLKNQPNLSEKDMEFRSSRWIRVELHLSRLVGIEWMNIII